MNGEYMDDFCCSKFRKAVTGRSDSEGYGSVATETDKGIYFGGMFRDDERIRFCPWCGTPVDEKPGAGE